MSGRKNNSDLQAIDEFLSRLRNGEQNLRINILRADIWYIGLQIYQVGQGRTSFQILIKERKC
jgi:hypothetical protein